MRRVVAASFALFLVAACGKNSSPASGSTPTPTAVASPTPVPAGGGPAGVWTVKGTDSRGAFTGQIEVKANGDHFDFTRVIRYDALTVEDSRELWWVFQGAFTPGADAIDATFSLKRADFVKSRDALMRTIADGPVDGGGHFTPVAGGWSGSWSGAADGTESWSALAPSGAAPIFAIDRTLLPAHDAPDATTAATLASTFASFRALPEIAIYANDPAFQAAIHGTFVDHTDFDFYQSHPTALRVVNKVIDPISLLETKMRADAFRWTLHDKAAYFDTETKD